MSASSRSVTFVIPVYNEVHTVEPLVEALLSYRDRFETQVVLVDDGSTDGSSDRCRALARTHANVQVVHFDNNRGKTEALHAGFEAAQGEIVFTLDSDLQDDPGEVPRFVEALDRGLDLVVGWKVDRQDPWAKRAASRIYNGFTARLFGLPLHDINSGYKAMRREVALSLEMKSDYHRLIPAMAAANGFRVGEIPVRHHRRAHGRSKFGAERYWKGLRDVVRFRVESMGRRGHGRTPD